MDRREKKNISGVYDNIKGCLLSVAAGLLYAIAFKYFVFPSRVILTGTEGIAAATSYFFDNHWLFIWMYLAFQSILVVFAFLKISFRFAFRTMLVIATVAALLSVLPEYQFASPEPHGERIILVIFGGLLAGIAKALAFRCNSSVGDEDIPAAYLSMKYLRPVGSIAIFAAVVSTAYGLVLTFIKTHQLEPVVNTLMYTSLYFFISAQTLNNFYRKFNLTLVNVITQFPDKIGESIRKVFPYRTYTIQEGLGGYSKARVKILRTIVTQEELSDVVNVIEAADKESFFFHNTIGGVSKQYYISPIG